MKVWRFLMWLTIEKMEFSGYMHVYPQSITTWMEHSDNFNPNLMVAKRSKLKQ